MALLSTSEMVMSDALSGADIHNDVSACTLPTATVGR